MVTHLPTPTRLLMVPHDCFVHPPHSSYWLSVSFAVQEPRLNRDLQIAPSGAIKRQCHCMASFNHNFAGVACGRPYLYA